MKKLFIISLLLLALVFTVVACKDDPVEPTDTTAGETTGTVEDPTAAPADDTTAKTEDPTAAPEVTTEKPEDPTEPPPAATTEKPEDPTDPPEDPTDPPVTEPVDPDAPLSMFDANALNSNTDGVTSITSFELIDNYLRITPATSDPNYYPLRGAEVVGGRFVAIKYRTPNADGTAVQFYLGSTGASPSDDTSMLRLSTIADGQWHVAIFDTQSLIDAGIYDGSTVAYFRFDPLECDYILDENGQPQKDPEKGWLRYDMPEGAYIDVQYVAFFNSAEAIEKYISQPLYIAGPAEMAAGSTSAATVTDNGTYATADGNVEGSNGDGWFMALNGGSIPGKFISVMYRTSSAVLAERKGEFFAGSGAGPVGGSSTTFLYTVDGEWHYAVVDVSAHPDLSGTMNYIRYDFSNDTRDVIVDIAYVAVFDSPEMAAAYGEMRLATLPNLEQATDIPFWTSVDHVNGAGPNGEPHYSGRGGNTNIGCDVIDGAADGKTVGFDYIVSIGGWCGTPGGIHRYVWTVDGITWYDCLEGSGRDGEPVPNHYSGLGYDDALKNGVFTGENFAKADLSAFAGQTVDVTFGVEPETAQGKVIAFVTITGLKVPGDDTHNFKSDVANQGESFAASDVANAFPAAPSAGGSWYDVTGQNGNKVNVGESYHLANYNEMFITADGRYAFSATILDNVDPNRNFMFVRGVRNFDWGDQGYFGHDTNNNYAGCGGINVMVKDGVLTIIIRSYTEAACVRNIYTMDVDSNKITLADDGKTVYIVVGDTLAATVEISGTRDFGYTGAAGAVAADACAAKVVLTMAGQEPVEIVDAVVAASCMSDIGMAIREHGNYITFSELSIAGFSTVTIPDFPAAPTDPLVVNKTEYKVGDAIMVYATGSGTDWVGIAARGATESIGWYYVEAVSGQTVNLFEKAQAGDGSALTSLPAGEYTVYLIPNDEALATATPIAAIDIIIVEPKIDEISVWAGNDGKLTHISHDVIRWEGGSQSGTGVNTAEAVIGDATSMLYAGWVGALDEVASFGYKIGDADPVWNAGWVNGAEDAVVNAAASTGATHANRFGILVDLSGVSGTQTISLLCQLGNGSVVCLIRFDLVGAQPAPSYTDAPAWDADKAVVTHQSFDELRINGAGGVFTAGQAANWDKVANLDASATSLYYWGWIGAKGEFGQFGYEIDQNGAIFDDSFTYPAEDGVVAAAAGTGADCASRMAITIDISALSGEHTVSVYYKNAAGEVVLLNAFTVNR